MRSIAAREAVLVAILLSVSALASFVSPASGSGGRREDVRYMFSGNQETLADPIRPVVYFGDGSSILIIDATTGATLDTIFVDGEAESLDLSHDSNTLYVALARTNKIAVIDLPSRTVRREIPLPFTPLSLRVGRTDRLYISNVPGEGQFAYVYVVNESSGIVLRDLYVSFAAALEVSPNGSILLTAWLFISPGEITRYNITTDNATQIGPSYYGPYFGRQSVDWDRNRMYVGSGIISLETMTVIESVYLGSVLFNAAFASNGTRIYGIVGSYYGPARSVWARDFVTGWETTARVVDNTGWVVVSGDGGNLIVGKPVQRVARAASLAPSYPRPNVVLNSTPRWVSAMLDFGLPILTLSNVTISVDGVPLSPHIFVPEFLEAVLNSTLSDGNHTVEYSLVFTEGVTLGTSWQFRIYANMRPPSVDALYPARESVEKTAVAYIQASVDHGDPSQPIDSVSMYLDGRRLSPSFESPEVLGAALPFPLGDGDYLVFGEISWNGGVGSFSWQFSVRIDVPPMASFSVTPGTFFVEDDVTFDASSSTDTQGTIVGYLWDFGDGAQRQGRIVAHAFAETGPFVVRLTVVDDRGLAGTVAMELHPRARPVGAVPAFWVVLSVVSMTIAIASALSGARDERERKNSRTGATRPTAWTLSAPSSAIFCIHCGAPSGIRDQLCRGCGRPVWRPPLGGP